MIPEQSGTIDHIDRTDSGTLWMVVNRYRAPAQVVSIGLDGHRTTYDLPDQDQTRGLSSIDMASDSYGWVAGLTKHRETGYAARWDGSKWTRVELPSYASPQETDWSNPIVRTSSPDNVWLLNNHALPSKLWSWDGSGWKERADVPPLFVVDVVTSGDTTWIASTPGGVGLGGTVGLPLTFVRIDPSGTTKLTSDVKAPVDAIALAGDGVFAVGGHLVDDAYRLEGIACTASGCSSQPMIDTAGGAQISAADASPDGAIWAVGADYSDSDPAPLALHKTESGWEKVDVPRTCAGSARAELNDASVASDDDVYVVGTCVNRGNSQILALHYDGEHWTSMVK